MTGPEAGQPLWPEANRRRARLVSCRRHVRGRDRLRKWKNDRGVRRFGGLGTVGLGIRAGLRDRRRQRREWRRDVARRELARPRPRPPFVLEGRALILNRLLRFQDARPVELDARDSIVRSAGWRLRRGPHVRRVHPVACETSKGFADAISPGDAHRE